MVIEVLLKLVLRIWDLIVQETGASDDEVIEMIKKKRKELHSIVDKAREREKAIIRGKSF